MTYRDDVPDGKFWSRKTRSVTDGKTTIILGFEWHGGNYIDVCRVTGQAFGPAAEVINVWNYHSDQPNYPRTKAGMKEAVDNWIKNYGENGPADLTHDVLHNWPNR